jgi:hypothetical protein
MDAYQTPLMVIAATLLACCRVFGFVCKAQYWQHYCPWRRPKLGARRRGQHFSVPNIENVPELPLPPVASQMIAAETGALPTSPTEQQQGQDSDRPDRDGTFEL